MERYQTAQRKGEIQNIIVHFGPPQTRFDSFLVVKKSSMTKHLMCKSSYRLQMVKNRVVGNKVVFLLKRKTTLVVQFSY